MSEYDDWKLKIPYNEKYQKIFEELTELDDMRFYQKCMDHGIQILNKSDDKLMEELAEHLFEKGETL